MENIVQIELFGLRIDEPIVTLTDLLVSFLCFLYFYKMSKSNDNRKVFMYFKYYFLVMGLATTFGGIIGHAFYYEFTKVWKLVGWIISMFAIMLIERGAIEHTRIVLNKKYVKILGVVNIIEFVVFLGLVLFTLDFFYVQLHSGYGLMFVVFTIEFLLFLKTKNKATQYVMAGIGFAALSALVFATEFSIHRWFNYLSLSHVMMAFATVFIYGGVKRIKIKENQPKEYV
ncbi:hypothetical protein [uncultured Marivirga sp.]|uniref:DUF6962 family protein n=1 Tax=uncultured Marivirga sp. TaxID=1123707 RepID=UPI0030EB20BE|tara:strand:+ start:253720 stop:254406 length:687 start_codon:yes stop_codon:yes gene_type:complete